MPSTPPRSSDERWRKRPLIWLRRRAAVRACPTAAMTTPTCRKRPRCPQQPDRALFLFVASTEIEMSERAQPHDLPPPREAARRRDEHQEAATTAEQSDLKFFVLRPANDQR